MISLPQLGYSPVISYKEVVALFCIRLALSALWQVSFLYHLVVMREDGRNVDAVGARHAVVVLVAKKC